MSLLRAAADLLFPPRCEVCRQLGAEGLCHECLARITRIAPPICHTCGRPLDEAGRALACSICRHRSLSFTYARAAGVYEGVLREAIHALKFDRRRSLAGPLARIMVQTWTTEMAGSDVILPVPLHRARFRDRGFNQSELLARELGRALGRPVDSGLLIRTRPTETQSSLDVRQRRDNVAEAFALRRTVEEQRILLVDDVISTGSTTSECARVLRDGGARAVIVMAVAMALPER